MRGTSWSLIGVMALAMSLAHAQQQAPGFPFQLPSSLPFIPMGPQPGEVPVNSPGWREIVNEYGAPVKSGAQTKLVEDVVAELSRGAGYVAPQGGYRSTLLDTSILNAFAIGDGNVFVTRQLLAYMNDEDELVGVLGHEIGHVIGGHSRFKGATNAAQRGGDLLIGTFLPPLQGLEQVGTTIVVRGFDRAQEHSADVAGVKFLADLGRDPNAMGRALSILDAEDKLQDKMFGARPPTALDYWLRDHPIHSERLALVQTAANMAPRAKSSPHRSSADFIRELDGMLFDDGPDQGIIDGGKFRHPILKFALDAPATFRLLNGATALSIRGPDGTAATLKTVSGTGSAAERFKAAWTHAFPAEIAAPTPEMLQIGGMPSAHGQVEFRPNDEPVRISLWLYAWSENQSFIYAAEDPKGAHDSEHAATAQSFRRLSDAEAAVIKVRRLKVIEIGAGDSVANLSQRMAYTDFREDRFRLINGLFDGQALPKAGPVKTVVWSAQ